MGCLAKQQSVQVAETTLTCPFLFLLWGAPLVCQNIHLKETTEHLKPTKDDKIQCYYFCLT